MLAGKTAGSIRSNAGKNQWRSEVEKGVKIKKRIIPLLTLLLVIGISVILFYFYQQYPDRIVGLKAYGYLGTFLISLFGNASILLPGIVLPILSGLGVLFYPVSGIAGPILVGLFGGAGAAIGEIVGYAAGYSGRRIVQKTRHYERLEKWVKRWGTLGIFLFALFPLFFDLVGLIAGVLRFPLWKFVLVCWLGRSILYVVIIVLAALGLKVVLPLFN